MDDDDNSSIASEMRVRIQRTLDDHSVMLSSILTTQGTIKDYMQKADRNHDIHGDRLTELEEWRTQIKTKISLLQWLAGVIITSLGALGLHVGGWWKH